MKYLIIVFLFITSCTDNIQETTLTLEEVVNTIKETPNGSSTINTIVASYNNSDNIILIESYFSSWYSALIRATDGQITLREAYDPVMYGYEATYWDSKKGVLYYANIEPTNGIQYTLDTIKQYEQILYSNLREVYTLSNFPSVTNLQISNLVDTCLLYAGSLPQSNNQEIIQRIYINKSDQQQFIKTLYPKEMIYKEQNMSTRLPMITPIYPAFLKEDDYDFPILIYTNTSRQAFRFYAEEGFILVNFPLQEKLFTP